MIKQTKIPNKTRGILMKKKEKRNNKKTYQSPVPSLMPLSH